MNNYRKFKLKASVVISGLTLLVLFNNCSGNGFRGVLDSSSSSSDSGSGSSSSENTVTSGLQVKSFQISSSSPKPGDEISFNLVLNFSDTKPLAPGHQAFVHFVGSSRPDWFEFSVFPLTGPASDLWKGDITFQGRIQIPSSAVGNYRVLAGVNDGSTNKESANIRLGAAPGITESFASGAIGYRYQVGNINVSTTPGTPPPVTGPSSLPTTPTELANIMISDMRDKSTFPIATQVNGQIVENTSGYPSAYSQIIMGNRPHGSAAPTWWPGYSYLRTVNWPNITPWLYVWLGTGNQASQTRIELRNMRAYYLTRTLPRQWRQLGGNGDVSGEYFSSGTGGVIVPQQPSDMQTPGGVTSVLIKGLNAQYHGWWANQGARLDDPNAMEIFYTRVEARIVGPDVARAQIMLHMGSDFYPDGVNNNPYGMTPPDVEPKYNPGSGYARAKALTTEWQVFTYTTINSSPNLSDQTRQYVGDEALLRQFPPPL